MLPNTLLGGLVLSALNMAVVLLVLGVIAALIELIHMSVSAPTLGTDMTRKVSGAEATDPPRGASIGIQELPMKVKH